VVVESGKSERGRGSRKCRIAFEGEEDRRRDCGHTNDTIIHTLCRAHPLMEPSDHWFARGIGGGRQFGAMGSFSEAIPISSASPL
jgi:hypothetical protein